MATICLKELRYDEHSCRECDDRGEGRQRRESDGHGDDTDRIPSPELDWYPRAFFRAQFIPDSLLDEWVASGDVRAKKANSSKQSTRFFRLSDVREKLESMIDVKVADSVDGDAQ